MKIQEKTDLPLGLQIMSLDLLWKMCFFLECEPENRDEIYPLIFCEMHLRSSQNQLLLVLNVVVCNGLGQVVLYL